MQRHTAQIHPEPGFNGLLDDDLQRTGSRTTSALVPDFSGATGRVNHIAYRVDQRLDVERAAEVFLAERHRRSSSARASTASTRSPTSTSASPAACASRSTRAAGSTTMPDWEPPVSGRAQGGDDPLEERADARVDDGVLAAGRRRQAEQAQEDFQKTDLFVEKA